MGQLCVLYLGNHLENNEIKNNFNFTQFSTRNLHIYTKLIFRQSFFGLQKTDEFNFIYTYLID